MILLTLRDLQHRALRFVVVIVLAAVVFALLFVMTGLVEQFNREPFDTVDSFGATAWVIPEGVSGPFTASSTLAADSLGAVDAAVAAPAVIARSSLADGATIEEVILIGHDPGALGSPPTIEGRAASTPGELVVDSTLDIDIGHTVLVAGAEFTVVGRAEDMTLLAGIPLVFSVTEDAQDLVFKSRDVISVVLVDGPIKALPSGTVAVDPDAVAEDVLGPLESAIASVDLVRGLLWMVAALIIGAVVYLSALERQRDFAVLKAIGSSNSSLLGSLALEAILVALLSVAFAAVFQYLLVPAFPLKVRVPMRAFWQVPLLAVVMALVAGAAGMRKVATSDPAAAFAGAGA